MLNWPPIASACSPCCVAVSASLKRGCHSFCELLGEINLAHRLKIAHPFLNHEIQIFRESARQPPASKPQTNFTGCESEERIAYIAISSWLMPPF